MSPAYTDYLCGLGVAAAAHNTVCPLDYRPQGSTRRAALEKTFLSTARRMEPSLKLRAEVAPLKEGH